MHPEIEGAPGLAWRRRTDGHVAYWVARQDIVKRGYPVRTVRLWPPSEVHHGGPPELEEAVNVATTQRYSRGALRRTSKVAVLRADFRGKK